MESRVMLNGDSNDNGKKNQLVLVAPQKTFPRATHFFVHFFAVNLHDYN